MNTSYSYKGAQMLKCPKCGKEDFHHDSNYQYTIDCRSCKFKTTIDYVTGYWDGVSTVEAAQASRKQS